MSLLSAYHLRFVRTIVYMLQQSEYRIWSYLKWLWRVKNFDTVQNRGTLTLTTVSKILLIIAWSSVALILSVSAALIYFYLYKEINMTMGFVGLFLLFGLPFVLSHIMIIPTVVGDWLIIKPLRAYQNRRARKIFSTHKGTTIAVAGSYGKTTMKQILATVLSEGKKVGYTKANYNVAVAHYRFAKSLDGDEDILVVEYGEYYPGDIAGFNKVVQPDIGVITGLNEAHLENFGTLENSAKNILSLAEYVGLKNLYINGESEKLLMFAPDEATDYTQKGVDGWKTDNIKIKPQSTEFTLKKSRKKINVVSGLVGRHNVGPLSVAAVIADRLGLDKKHIESGFKKTEAFEHRLQPSKQGDVVIIDDTYNGNIDGIRVGVELLSEIKAKRRIYVTPGLVEQGSKTKVLHEEIGRMIAPVADVVVLMKNSTTPHIKTGLKEANFKGDLIEIDEPLKFYTNLSQLTAAGDVVLMQNDWTDNYA